MVSAQAKTNAVCYLRTEYELSERKACGLIGALRSSCRYRKKSKSDFLENRLRELAAKKIAYGYRRLCALLQSEGHKVNHKRVYRLYKKNSLERRQKQRKRFSYTRSKKLEKPSGPNQIWAMDFMSDSCANGSKLRILNVLDLFARECPAITIGSSLPSSKVIATLEALSQERGLPGVIKVDNGPEYRSKRIQAWASERGVSLNYITPGKPMENGYIESFNGKLREECLNHNWFKNLREASAIIEDWRREYNAKRPHSALGYLSPEQFVRNFAKKSNLSIINREKKVYL